MLGWTGPQDGAERREDRVGPAQGGSEQRRHFSMLRSFHLADFFTLANGSCGTAAIFSRWLT